MPELQYKPGVARSPIVIDATVSQSITGSDGRLKQGCLCHRCRQETGTRCDQSRAEANSKAIVGAMNSRHKTNFMIMSVCPSYKSGDRTKYQRSPLYSIISKVDNSGFQHSVFCVILHSRVALSICTNL